MPRRKPNTLLPLELSILDTALELRVRGARYFHGFMMASELKGKQEARLLTAHGTLYKALDRLRKLGFLESEWEGPALAASEGRPRRRFYFMTAAGEAALAQARESPALDAWQRSKGMATQ